MTDHVFPQPYCGEGPNVRPAVGGLTKRELFAAMAMQGEMSPASMGSLWEDYGFNVMAQRCVKAADALLKALEARDG